MKRTGTVTVPYTFCLFCGVIGLVLLMAGTFASLALRDIRGAEPALASRVLQEAIAPTIQTLSNRMEGPLRQMDLLRHWANGGLVPESNPARWPSVLLPAVCSLDGVRAVYLVRENGAACRLYRTDKGWVGSAADPGNLDGALSGMLWDGQGQAMSGGGRDEELTDFRIEDWYQKALASSDTGVTSAPVVLLADLSLTLAIPLRFSKGQRGCLALELDNPILNTPREAGTSVELVIEAGGDRVVQIQDEQTLALLQEKAIPGDNSVALAQFFSPAPPQATYWYGARSYTLSDSGTWWVIARVKSSALPVPSLPVFEYTGWALAMGLAGAVVLSLVFGRHITRPLRQVAARARGVHVLDEHYLPWPRSRFTEVNILTSALEEIYEAAVEHLDYHDAPLVTWAEPDGSTSDGTVDADAVRHVFQFPRGLGEEATPGDSVGAVIDVAGEAARVALPESIPAAQLQVLHGTRKEIRRLQSQLAGACEELRTADIHYQQDQARMKRQRNCLRGLERLLLVEGCASEAMLGQIREILGATRVSLWTAGRTDAQFHLSGACGLKGGSVSPFVAPFGFMALLQSESLVAVQDPTRDPRLLPLSAHPSFQDSDEPRLVAPIRLAGRLLGFLIAERPAGLGRWKGDEELFVLGIANACAGVLWHQLRNRSVASTSPFSAQIVVQGPQARSENGRSRKNGGFRRSANSGAVLYWEIDRAGCIKSIEGDVQSLYGRSRDQLIGQPITFLSKDGQGQRDMEKLAALLAGQRCKGYETCHVAANGRVFFLAVHAQVWRDASDRIVGARGTLEPLSAAVAT